MIRKLITLLRPHDDQAAPAPGADARATRAAWGEALTALGSILHSIGTGMVRSAYEDAETELAGGGPEDDPDGGLEIRQLPVDGPQLDVDALAEDPREYREAARAAG